MRVERERDRERERERERERCKTIEHVDIHGGGSATVKERRLTSNIFECSSHNARCLMSPSLMQPREEEYLEEEKKGVPMEQVFEYVRY